MIEVFDRVDGMAPLRNALRQIGVDREHWAGLPMPMDGHPMIIEPTYPYAEGLMKIGLAEKEQEPDNDAKIRNRFWSWSRRAEILIWEENGKIEWGRGSEANQTGYMLSTLGASDAWGIEQEGRAVQLLGTLLRHRNFKQYLLTGMFMESSKRSGVVYLFRRLRPTIALSMRGKFPRILAALCLHPIGYYQDSWAGAMCPTDEVVAHLMLMRGDEHMFWRRANQHPSWVMNAGIS